MRLLKERNTLVFKQFLRLPGKFRLTVEMRIDLLQTKAYASLRLEVLYEYL